jgi:hypothetical protein
VATFLAGVDIGTSGAKAVLFDLAGKSLASACQEYPCTYPGPGWVEQDADHVVEATSCEQHFPPAANLMISKKIKKSRIHLTNSPECGRLPYRSLLYRTRRRVVALSEGAGMKALEKSSILSKIGGLSRFNFN